MANPTTNYSFVLPTSSDLVTDLPADFDVALQGVDTRLKALQPGTTSGDLAYSSATANTNVRLGIGTPGQVLGIASGVPAWTTPAGAGGMTLLSTTTLAGATTTISSIDQTYNKLEIYIFGVTNATANGALQVAPNAITDKSVRGEFFYISSPESTGLNGAAGGKINLSAGQSILRTSTNNAWCLSFPNYASTTAMKPYSVCGGFVGINSTQNAFGASGFYYETTAISSLVFNSSGGNLSTGTVLIYGVK